MARIKCGTGQGGGEDFSRLLRCCCCCFNGLSGDSLVLNGRAAPSASSIFEASPIRSHKRRSINLYARCIYTRPTSYRSCGISGRPTDSHRLTSFGTWEHTRERFPGIRIVTRQGHLAFGVHSVLNTGSFRGRLLRVAQHKEEKITRTIHTFSSNYMRTLNIVLFSDSGY